MAVYSSNCTVGLEGLYQTLLVFGKIPRQIRKRTSPTQIIRAAEIDNTMKDAGTEQTNRRIEFWLRYKKGPYEVETSKKLRRLTAGAQVLVYRTKSKKWEGPHTIVSVEGETSIVRTYSGPKIHRLTCLRLWVRSTFETPTMKEGDGEGKVKREEVQNV